MKEENSNNTKKKKSLLYYIFKRIKLSHLIILIILISANTYAWFIYVNSVSNSVDVHVRSWRIDFQDENSVVTDYVDVYVNDVYPGMTTFTKNITAYNYSEVAADVSFKILEASVLGTTYTTLEGRSEYNQTPQTGDLTSAQLVSKLANDYPFAITFTLSSATIPAVNGTATYTINVSWPYESGDDAADTLWGTNAYTFKQNHPIDPCLRMIVKIYITQAS